MVSGENKKGNLFKDCLFGGHVGMTRFELATPRPPDVCATGLRYIPKKTKNKHRFRLIFT